MLVLEHETHISLPMITDLDSYYMMLDMNGDNQYLAGMRTFSHDNSYTFAVPGINDAKRVVYHDHVYCETSGMCSARSISIRRVMACLIR